MRNIVLTTVAVFTPFAHPGCAAAPDPAPVAEVQQNSNSPAPVKGPAMFAAAFTDAFSASSSGLVYAGDGSTAAWTAWKATPAGQSFAPLLFAAPDGSGRDRVIGYTAPLYGAKTGTSLAGITLSTSAAQQLICPVTGLCATSIGGITPSLVMVPNVADSADSVLHDLCGSRPLCTGIVLVADGPVGQRVAAGGTLTNFALTGPGKLCAPGDGQMVCEGKYAGTTGTFVLGDTRLGLASGITVLNLDGVAPTAANIRSATYPSTKPLHIVDRSDTNIPVVIWWLWFDGDGTMSHPDHYASWASMLTTRGFVPLSGSPIVITP